MYLSCPVGSESILSAREEEESRYWHADEDEFAALPSGQPHIPAGLQKHRW